MPKLSLKAGTTSKSVGLFIQDSSSTTGAGLTGLVFNTASLVAYWYQPGVSAPAAITLATLSTITGAYSSGGFKEADATNMPGHYRLDIPNAVLTGATSAVIGLKGATNMAPCVLEIELTATDNQSSTGGITLPTNFSALAITAAGGVTLADGVTHGGTPGSSTATLALMAARILNPAGVGLSITGQGDGECGAEIIGASIGLAVTGLGGAGANITGTDSGLYCYASAAGPAAPYSGALVLEATGGNALTVIADDAGHGISVTGAGSGKSAISLTPGSGGYGIDGTLSPAVLSSFLLQDTGHVFGDAVTGSIVKLITANAGGGTPPTASVIAAAVWDEILTGATHNIQNSSGKILRTIGPNTGAIYSGTLPSQSGMTSVQIKLDSGASASNSVYNDDVISILTGTGAGQSAFVTDYVGSTRIATVDTAWTIQPASGATFEITPTARTRVVGSVTVGAINANVITATSIAAAALNGKGDWLTSLGTNAPAGWLNAAAIGSGALNGKGDWSTLTAAGVWLAGTRTLTSGSGIVLQKGIGVTGFSDLDAAGVRAAVGMDVANLDTQLEALPTAAETVDKLLGRNIAGGSDGGRTVSEAMAFLRNKWEISGGTLIVYAANDSTTLWTASVATTAGNPVTSVDPS